MVVRERRELDQNLADHTDARFFDRAARQLVKVLDDRTDNASVFTHRRISLRDGLCADGAPLLVELVGTAGNRLIGTSGIEAAHHHVAVDRRLNRLDCHRNCDLEARVLLHVAHIDRDDRNVAHARFFERAANEADVVRSAAAAAGLAHEDRCVLQVVLAGEQRVHDLANRAE